MRKLKVTLTVLVVIISTLLLAVPVQADTITSKDYTWQYGGFNYSMHLSYSTDALNAERALSNDVRSFYFGNYYYKNAVWTKLPEEVKPLYDMYNEHYGYYVPWINNNFDDKAVQALVGILSKQTAKYNYFHKAEFILNFVGALSYVATDAPQLPMQTLFDGGDCKDKAILLAAILKDMGYKVALLNYQQRPGEAAGHEAIGIAFGDSDLPLFHGPLSYYTEGGVKYYYTETTSPGWSIGQLSPIAQDHPAYVYPVNQGLR